MSDPVLKLITTEDGSHSLLREDLDETYHSSHGARGESEHVFIQMGLEFLREQKEKSEAKVFEVGLGTGLNAFLAALFGIEKKIVVDFHSIEPIPIPKEIYSNLNFGYDEDSKSLLNHIHQSEWGSKIKINDHFSLTKYEITLEQLSINEHAGTFDAIFFDAFAPSKQPEVWALENIQKCYDLLRPDGILTCYSAQGQFKRDLKAVGFQVDGLPGAMGKREMIRATKPY